MTFNKLIFKGHTWEAESDDGQTLIVKASTWANELHKRSIAFFQVIRSGISPEQASEMLRNRHEYPDAERAFNYVSDLLQDPYYWTVNIQHNLHLSEPDAAVRIVRKQPIVENLTNHCTLIHYQFFNDEIERRNQCPDFTRWQSLKAAQRWRMDSTTN